MLRDAADDRLPRFDPLSAGRLMAGLRGRMEPSSSGPSQAEAVNPCHFDFLARISALYFSVSSWSNFQVPASFTITLQSSLTAPPDDLEVVA